MKKLTPNEMAVERYKIAMQLIDMGNALLDPNEDYRNVCYTMDGLGGALNDLDSIRHSAFPKWFEKTPNKPEEKCMREKYFVVSESELKLLRSYAFGAGMIQVQTDYGEINEGEADLNMAEATCRARRVIHDDSTELWYPLEEDA